MQIYKSLLLFFVISLTTFPSFATKISVISALSCNTGNVLLTSIRNSNELGTELISNIYSATGCAAFSGNADGGGRLSRHACGLPLCRKRVCDCLVRIPRFATSGNPAAGAGVPDPPRAPRHRGLRRPAAVAVHLQLL